MSGISSSGAVFFQPAPDSSAGLDFASREDGTGTLNDPFLILTVTTG